jgi:hypothetical protein
MRKEKVQKARTAKANLKERVGGALEATDFMDVAVDVEKDAETKAKAKASRRAKAKESQRAMARTMARKVDRKASRMLTRNNVDYAMNLDIGQESVRTG